jgi:hypothetical protein
MKMNRLIAVLAKAALPDIQQGTGRHEPVALCRVDANVFDPCSALRARGGLLAR